MLLRGLSPEARVSLVLILKTLPSWIWAVKTGVRNTSMIMCSSLSICPLSLSPTSPRKKPSNLLKFLYDTYHIVDAEIFASLGMEGTRNALSEGVRTPKGLSILYTTEMSFTCAALTKKFFSGIKKKMQWCSDVVLEWASTYWLYTILHVKIHFACQALSVPHIFHISLQYHLLFKMLDLDANTRWSNKAHLYGVY